MAELKRGDVIEVRAQRGLAYVLYTHHSLVYGELVRVTASTFHIPPKDFQIFSRDAVIFDCFAPMALAVKKGLARVVSHIEVPAELQTFPTFRFGARDPDSGRVKSWWLWDGERKWEIGELTPEQRRLSILGPLTIPHLCRRIDTGWTPETDPA